MTGGRRRTGDVPRGGATRQGRVSLKEGCNFRVRGKSLSLLMGK